MGRINSRAKGARGERAFRDVLRAAGYNARRGAQYSGHVEAPDVICYDLPDIHFEVKCVENGNVYNFVEQAQRDSAGKKYPVVALKRNGREWLAILPMDDFLRMIAHSDLVAAGKKQEGEQVPSNTPCTDCSAQYFANGKLCDKHVI